jgi:transposase
VRAARSQATRPAGSELLEQENKQLRVQLARTEMERGIFKKVLTIFSQPTGR